MTKRLWMTVCAVALGTAAGAQDALFDANAYSDYQADVANGEVIFNAAGCATCHAVDGADDILAGGQAISTKFGELYAPNITHHGEAGIGNWSNATFLNAVLRGTSPEGETYFGAVFPYPSYARMSPEDALDLRGYLATLPSSDAPSKEHNISYMSQTILDLWSSGRDALKVPSDPQLARGQYLVEAVGHCAECHTPRDTGFGFKYELDMTRPYEGEVGLLGEYAPNITGERLAKFGAEAFVIGAMAEAKKLNGNPMVSTSMRRIARQTANLSLDDRAAMYAYLTGAPLDVSSLPQAPTPAPEPLPQEVAETQTPAPTTPPVTTDATPQPLQVSAVSGQANVIPDYTAAKALMTKVEAYCESQAPIEQIAVPAPTPQITPVASSGPSPELTKAADQVIETHCRACHAPGKTYAAVFPTGDIADMPFDDRIVKPGNPDGSPLFESIASGRMPLGQQMTADEVATLKNWIEALGKPEVAQITRGAAAVADPTPQAPTIDVPMPEFAGFTRTERMLAVVADVNALEERDRPFVRYISFAQMPLADIDCNAVGALKNPMHYMHAGFNKFINSVSLGPRVVPVMPVEGTEGAIVRIDLRDYGWDHDDWAALSTGVFTQGGAEAGFTREVWTDLAEVYPYAIDPESDPLLRAVADATGAAVPIMRADWVSHFGAEAPYYDMFLGLTEQIADLERRLGIDVNREIGSGRVVRAAMLQGASGVSDHNRMLERFDLPRGGYYWKSYDFAGDIGRQSLTLHPDGPEEVHPTASGTEPFEHDGGEMIFSLPNGLQGYYLSTNKGDRLLVGPASIVSFRNKPIGKGVEIENARSCFDCHANGMIAKSDQLRDVLLSSQRFSRDELDRLLGMYVENDVLADVFRQDAGQFLGSLSLLNATQVNAAGRLESLRAPQSVGGGEIFTYLADMHFDAVGLTALAREFHMDLETLRIRAGRLGDPTLTVVLNDWLSRLDAGSRIHRDELEKYYADILERITDLRPYRPVLEAAYTPQPIAPQQYEQVLEEAVKTVVEKQAEVYAPAVTAPVTYAPPVAEMNPERLKLAIHVPRTEVYVNDLLEFTVTADQRCELQILYVEESKTIEEMPQAILGPVFLEPGEVRKIPYEGSGLQIRFDEPGKGETMLAFCRVGGLGDKRMTAQGALDYARSHFQPLTRGISIEAANTVASDGGASATNHVTFNVLP